MKKAKRPLFTGLILLFAMLANLAWPTTVFADEGTPPVATREPVVEEMPTTEPVIEDESTPEPTAGEQIPSEPEPVSEILEQLPEDTQLIVLDEHENVEPLATQTAAEILTASDPMWCPTGVAPIANTDGCTASYTDFASLLLYLDANEPAQAGVIWIEKGYDSGVNDAGVTSFFLDGTANLLTMKNYALTLQGGWNGDSAGTISHADPSEFNATLNIVNWNGNVTLNDLLITETHGAGMNFHLGGVIGYSANGAGLSVSTTGDVNLSNVKSTENSATGVFIYNTSGLGTVSVQDGNFSDNGAGFHGGLGIYIRSNGAISLNNITASRNRWAGGMFFNDAIGAHGDVTLTGTNEFNHNGMDGVMISSVGAINASNMTVNENGLTGAYVYNFYGPGNPGVTINDSAFSGNGGSGSYIYSDGLITLNNIIGSGNGGGGLIVIHGLNVPAQEIIFTGTNVFEGNSGYGLYIGEIPGGAFGNVTMYSNITTAGTVILGPVSIDQLPGSLPEVTTFVSALQVLQSNDIVVISFAIPEGLHDSNLSILYWDGTAWLDLASTTFEDGREVIDGGHKTDNGFYEAIVNFGGTFVLVQK
jgi:hypothetical protein